MPRLDLNTATMVDHPDDAVAQVLDRAVTMQLSGAVWLRGLRGLLSAELISTTPIFRMQSLGSVA